MTDIASSQTRVAQPSVAREDNVEGMEFLETFKRRLVFTYLPLGIIVFVLLFPFYWMALTAVKPDNQLLDMETFNPLWTWNPTFKHISKLLFESNYPKWLWNTMYVATAATALSLFASVLAAYAIVRLQFKGAQLVGGLIFLAYLVPPSILFIPLASIIYQYGLIDTPLSLILVYPTILIPFATWLLMGYFKSIPFELEESALMDGASRWQILTKIVLQPFFLCRRNLSLFFEKPATNVPASLRVKQSHNLCRNKERDDVFHTSLYWYGVVLPSTNAHFYCFCKKQSLAHLF